MGGTLKKLNLDDLKMVNGGQIFYAKEGNKTEYFVPWPAENDVNVYNKAWEAKIRAEDLGLFPEFKESFSSWLAEDLAREKASHYNSVDRINSYIL